MSSPTRKAIKHNVENKSFLLLSEMAPVVKKKPDLVMVAARLFSWMVFLLLLSSAQDLSVLAHSVTFPSDQSLKINLPEWQPADRASREAQWKSRNPRPQLQYNRRGQQSPIINHNL